MRNKGLGDLKGTLRFTFIAAMFVELSTVRALGVKAMSISLSRCYIPKCSVHEVDGA